MDKIGGRIANFSFEFEFIRKNQMGILNKL